MNDFLQILFIAYLLVCCAALVLYLPRIWYYIYAFKKQKKYTTDRKNKFAVLVPARDESTVINFCLSSLKNQTYPSAYFDIHVIVADKNDSTVDIVKNYANIFVHVVENQTCKGQALDGALQEILKSNTKYDAYVIIDADNIADKNFLWEMNNAMQSGRQIINGKKGIKNWQSKARASRTLVTNCAALSYTNVDDMGNKFRNLHGIPISITGTGVLIRADVIEQLNGWPYRTLTEDYQLTMECVLKGFSSMYYEHAVVYTEEVLSLKESNKRRKRWVRGFAQCNALYRKQIVKQTFSGGIKWRNLDILYSLWPVILFAAATVVTMLFGSVAALTKFWNRDKLWVNVFAQYTLLPFGVVYSLLFVFTGISLTIIRKEMKIGFFEKLKVWFLNPIYLLKWLQIYVIAFLTRKEMIWEKIERVCFELDMAELNYEPTACGAD
jgi:cellulose synthase/poly-beta-1,6-N-acetylglucosamine synthase-like glycosyltransferase